MEYGVLNLPTIPLKKKHKAWNKGLTWDDINLPRKSRKKILKNLRKGNSASCKVRIGKPACNSEPVICMNPENNQVLGRFESSRFAMKATGAHERCIRKTCNGERKTAGGFKWVFEKDLFK